MLQSEGILWISSTDVLLLSRLFGHCLHMRGVDMDMLSALTEVIG